MEMETVSVYADASNFEDRYENFDKVTFGLMCRSMEVHAVNNRPELAVSVLRDYFEKYSPRAVVTFDTQLIDVTEVRIANALKEFADVETVGDYTKASRMLMLEIPNIALRSLNKIDRIVEQVQNNEQIFATLGLNEAEREMLNRPGEPLALMETEQVSQIPQSKVSTVSDAVDVLVNASGDSLAEIDDRITQLQNEISSLKRVRKFLSPATVSPRKASTTKKAADPQMESKIVEAINSGRVRIKEIATSIDIPWQAVAQCVKQSERVSKNENGDVVLVS